MQNTINTPDVYIENIQEERKKYVSELRKVILDNIPVGFHEEISYGMIGYVVPHSTYPSGYHCDPKLPLPFINIASQKNHIGFYHMGIYTSKDLLDWFVGEYPKHCTTKLDMGKSCIRFKKFDQIPYKLIGELVRKMSVQDWIDLYDSNIKK